MYHVLNIDLKKKEYILLVSFSFLFFINFTDHQNQQDHHQDIFPVSFGEPIPIGVV